MEESNFNQPYLILNQRAYQAPIAEGCWCLHVSPRWFTHFPADELLFSIKAPRSRQTKRIAFRKSLRKTDPACYHLTIFARKKTVRKRGETHLPPSFAKKTKGVVSQSIRHVTGTGLSPVPVKKSPGRFDRGIFLLKTAPFVVSACRRRLPPHRVSADAIAKPQVRCKRRQQESE